MLRLNSWNILYRLIYKLYYFHSKRSLSSKDQNQFIDLASNFILGLTWCVLHWDPKCSWWWRRPRSLSWVDRRRRLHKGTGSALPGKKKQEKHRSILEATVCSSCYVLIVSSWRKGGKKMTARKRVLCPRLTYRRTARLNAPQWCAVFRIWCQPRRIECNKERLMVNGNSIWRNKLDL